MKNIIEKINKQIILIIGIWTLVMAFGGLYLYQMVLTVAEEQILFSQLLFSLVPYYFPSYDIENLFSYSSFSQIVDLIMLISLLVGLIAFWINDKQIRILRFSFILLFINSILDFIPHLYYVIEISSYYLYEFSATITLVSNIVWIIVFAFMIKALSSRLEIGASSSNYFNANIEIGNASKLWKRFVNYFVDLLFILLLLTRMVDGSSSRLLFDAYGYIVYCIPYMGDYYYQVIISFTLAFLFFYFLYYLFTEVVLGVTLGQALTQTRAIRQEGAKTTWVDRLIRSLCRLIPLEPISFFFGLNLHDSFSSTMVVDERVRAK